MRNPDNTGLGILLTGTLWVVVVMVGFCLTGCGVNAPPNPALAQAKADAAKAHQAALYALETQQKAITGLNKAVAFLEKAHEAPTEAATKALLTRADEAAVQAGMGPLLPEAMPPEAVAEVPVAPAKAKVEPISTQQPVAQTTAYTAPVPQEEIEYTSAGSWRPPVPQAPQAPKPPVPQAPKATVVKMKVKAMAHPKPSPQPAPQAGRPTCTAKTIPCVEEWIRYWAVHNGVHAVNAKTLLAIRRQESGTGPNIWRRGAAREYGAMQILPATADWLKLPHSFVDTPEGNALAAAKKYATCLIIMKQDLFKSVTCYNGEGLAARAYAKQVLKIRSQLA
jgi:hypothetical protein